MFYTNGISSILNQFNSDLENGLSADALQKARAQYGKNEIGATQKTGQFAAFLKSLLNWRVCVLAVATAVLIAPFIIPEIFAVSDVPHTTTAGGVIGAMLALHIGWACFTEYRIHRREAQVQEYLGLSIQVIRGGKLEKCAPEDIVPGDLISVSKGDYIPADARIVEAYGLVVDESALFGTKGTVQKRAIRFRINRQRAKGMPQLLSLPKNRKTWCSLAPT